MSSFFTSFMLVFVLVKLRTRADLEKLLKRHIRDKIWTKHFDDCVAWFWNKNVRGLINTICKWVVVLVVCTWFFTNWKPICSKLISSRDSFFVYIQINSNQQIPFALPLPPWIFSELQIWLLCALCLVVRFCLLICRLALMDTAGH